jgi:XapX domain-containing protein
MKDIIFALLAGLVVGLIFGKLRLPTPAPPTIAGVVGILGVTLGAMLGNRW